MTQQHKPSEEQNIAYDHKYKNLKIQYMSDEVTGQMFPISLTVNPNLNRMRRAATFYGFHLHENDWK